MNFCFNGYTKCQYLNQNLGIFLENSCLDQFFFMLDQWYNTEINVNCLNIFSTKMINNIIKYFC